MSGSRRWLKSLVSVFFFIFLLSVFPGQYSNSSASTLGTTDAVAVKGSGGSSSASNCAGNRVFEDELVSGKIGKNTIKVEIGTGVNLPNKYEFYGITTIGIQEVNNRPCRVQLFGCLLDS